MTPLRRLTRWGAGPVAVLALTVATAAAQDVSGAAVPAAVEAAAGRFASIPHDLSPWGMFMAADIIVKSVMIGLVAASVVTWTILFAKSLDLLGAKARTRRVLKRVLGAESLDAAAAALSAAAVPAG